MWVKSKTDDYVNKKLQFKVQFNYNTLEKAVGWGDLVDHTIYYNMTDMNIDSIFRSDNLYKWIELQFLSADGIML
jgi:hypothetical protein